MSVVLQLLDKDARTRLGTTTSIKDDGLFAKTDWAALEAKRVDPPHVPKLPSYFDFGPDGHLVCSQNGPLPKLDDDGESDDSEDDRCKARKKHGDKMRPDAFKGFSFAGDDPK